MATAIVRLAGATFAIVACSSASSTPVSVGNTGQSSRSAYRIAFVEPNSAERREVNDCSAKGTSLEAGGDEAASALAQRYGKSRVRGIVHSELNSAFGYSQARVSGPPLSEDEIAFTVNRLRQKRHGRLGSIGG
jgi:hypothetical protein